MLNALERRGAFARASTPSTRSKAVTRFGAIVCVMGLLAGITLFSSPRATAQAGPECPAGYELDTITGDECVRIEDAQQGPDTCPQGSQGTAPDCYIVVARGPGGECAEGILAGSLCVVEGDPPVATEGACPVSTTVFLSPDGFCYSVVDPAPDGECPAIAIEIDGECRVPEPIPPGPLTCPDPTFTFLDRLCIRYDEPLPPPCPAGSEEDPATSECRQPVDPDPGEFFCADPDAQLSGEFCVLTTAPLEPDTLSLTIIKEAPDAAPGETFEFEGPDGLPVLLGDGDQISYDGFTAGGGVDFSEFLPDDWDYPTIDCTNTDEEVFELDNAVGRSAAVEVVFDTADIVCTFTNVPAPTEVSLTIIKEAPDAALGETFEFSGPDGVRVFLGDGDQVTYDGYQPGNRLEFDEFIPDGWAYPIIDCTNSDEDVFTYNNVGGLGVQIEAPLGTEDVVCTITNVLADPNLSLTIRKVAPEAEPGQLFEFEDPDGNPAALADGDEIIFEGYTAGDFVTFAEFLPDGWADPLVECTNTDEIVIPIPGESSSVEVRFGLSDIVCTVTNTPLPNGLSLTVIKEAPDAAPGEVFEFAGPDGITVFLGDGDQTTYDGFADGDDVSFSEFLPDGWVDPLVDCTNTDVVPLPFPDFQFVDINFQFGTDDVVCTITNVPADSSFSLTIRKIAPDAEPGQLFEFADPNGNPVPLGDGDEIVFDGYSTGDFALFTEFLPPGWADPIVDCTNTDEVGIPFPGESLDVEVQFGTDDIVCTVSNSKIGLTLTINKEAPGADPGETFEFIGPFGSIELGDGDQGSLVGFLPNQLSGFTEILPTGWGEPQVTCDAETFVFALPETNEVSIEIEFADENVTCTVTNQPRPTATLTVTKEVVGGDPTQTDFTFSDAYGVIGSAEDGESFTTTINAGLFDLFEDQITGWRVASIDCTGALFADPNLDFGSVFFEAEPDATIECTFVNEAVRPIEIELTKIIEDADPADITFNFLQTSTGESVDLGDGDSHVFTAPNGLFRVEEFADPAWFASDFTCSDGEISWSADPLTGSAFFEVVTTGVASDVELITCTVTNSPTVPATLTVSKVVDGEHAGETFEISTPAGTITLADGQSETVDLVIDPSGFVFEEPGDEWLVPLFECTSDNPETVFTQLPPIGIDFAFVSPGDAIECTVTNTPKPLTTISITKEVEGVSDATVFVFDVAPGETLELAAGETGSVDIDIDFPNTYTLFEQQSEGWVGIAIDCTSSNPDTLFEPFPQFGFVEIVPLTPGDIIDCTFVNELDGPATVTINKIVDPDTDTSAFEFFSNDGRYTLGNGDSFTFELDPSNQAFISENFPLGWEANIECTGVDDYNTSTFTTGATLDFRATPNDIIECTFTNTAIPPLPLSVTKEITGEGSEPAIFEIYANRNFELGPGDTEFIEIYPGEIVTLGEYPQLGWELQEIDCGPVTLTPRNPQETFFRFTVPDDVTFVQCTVVNAPLEPAEITIEKIVDGLDPNPDGTFFEFQTPVGSQWLQAGQSVTVRVAPGMVNISENLRSRSPWELQSVDCGAADATIDSFGDVAINASPGEQITCAFTNSWAPPATIAITKQIEGDVDPGDTIFHIAHRAGSVFIQAGETQVVAAQPGTNKLFEPPVPGWVISSIECSGAPYEITQPNPVNTVAVVEVSEGDQIECVFTNRPARPSTLTLIKETIDAPADDTTIFTLADVAGTDVDISVGNPVTIEVEAGSEYFTEQLLDNPGWELAAFSCTEDHNTTSSGVTPGMRVTIPHETDVECTITNRKIEPVSITITKVTVDDPGDRTFDFYGWQYSAGSLNLPSLGNGESHTFFANPGGFELGEFLDDLWDEEILCTGDPEFLYAFFGGQVRFGAEAGDVVDCTFTNTYNPAASITLNKVVLDEPTNADPFDIYVFGDRFEVVQGTPVTVPVPAGFTNIFEAVPEGWTLTAGDCTSGDSIVSGSNYVSLRIEEGDEIECTFTNRRIETANITVTKITDPASDEQFVFDGPSGTAYIRDGETAIVGTVMPGNYNVSENLPAGWELGDVECDTDFLIQPPQPSIAAVQLEVVEGVDVNCTFTNNAIEPSSITVTKVIDGADDGTSFEFFSSFGSFTLIGGESVTVDVNPGWLSFTEQSIPGWTVSSVECDVPSDRFFDNGDGASVRVDASENVSCTITNTPEDSASITVTKQVNGEDDGTEFGFSANNFAFPLLNGESFTFEAAAGSVFLFESLPVGWVLSDIDCTGADDAFIDLASSRAFLQVSPGAVVECLFINEPAPSATLELTKVVTGGDNPPVFEFDVSPSSSVSLAAGETVSIDIPVGFIYVSERVTPGWDVADIVCEGADDVFERVELRGVELRVSADQTVQCTFTNEPAATDIVRLTKEIDGEDDGTVFTFEAPSGVYEVAGGETIEIAVVPNSTTTIIEIPQAGWLPSQFACTGAAQSGARGEVLWVRPDRSGVAECTLVNKAVDASTMTIRKEVDGLDDGTMFAFEGPNGESFVLGGGEEHTLDLAAGFHNVNELSSPGWELSDISCDRRIDVFEAVDGEAGGSVGARLGIGEDLTCTFTNNLTARPAVGFLTIEKKIEDGPVDETFEFVGPYGDRYVLGDGDSTTIMVEAGVSVVVSEEASGEWLVKAATCTDDEGHTLTDRELTVTVAEGVTAVCTFVNAPPPTPTPTPTSTSTPTPTPTSTSTPTPTPTSTSTPTPTPTSTSTPTPTPTSTSTPTPTPTSTSTPTPTPTSTATPTPTSTSTPTPTPTPRVALPVRAAPSFADGQGLAENSGQLPSDAGDTAAAGGAQGAAGAAGTIGGTGGGSPELAITGSQTVNRVLVGLWLAGFGCVLAGFGRRRHVRENGWD